ncbi:hypothetical protein GCM10020216_099580 [Nonomuraea helvata]
MGGVSDGTITGRAAAVSIRASMSIKRWCGSWEEAIRNAFDRPGRIGSGIRASKSAASSSCGSTWSPAPPPPTGS